MNKTQEQILKELFEYAEALGMHIYFDSSAEEFRGFIIGTDDFLMDILDGSEDIGEYDRVTDIEYKSDREGMH